MTTLGSSPNFASSIKPSYQFYKNVQNAVVSKSVKVVRFRKSRDRKSLQN